MAARAISSSAPSVWPWLLCYTVSGFCLLSLEMLWVREVTLWAGNTALAATLVIAVFFLAAALGNLAGAWWCRQQCEPLAWYGRCEALAGVSALVTYFLAQWWWQQETVGIAPSFGSFAATGLLVGVPSFFSGAALPQLMERFVPEGGQRTARGGFFYGANLLGAACGVACGGVWLPWKIGLSTTFVLIGLLQIAQSLVACVLARKRTAAPSDSVSTQAITPPLSRSWSWLVPGLTGALALAAQGLVLMWTRQIVPGSIYSLSAVLAVFLAGLGLGAWLAGGWRRRGGAAVPALAFFAGLSAALLFLVPLVGETLVARHIEWSATTPLLLLLQAVGACSVVLLPLTIALGGVFPLAWELAWGESLHEGSVAGAAIALNKIGSALGLSAASFLLLPTLGLAHSVNAVAWGYAAVAIVLLVRSTNRSRVGVAALGLVLIFGVWQTLRPTATLGLRPSERALANRCGPYGTVAVVEDVVSGSRHLLLNSQQRLSGTQNALSSQRLQGWVPLLFCPDPQRVLTLGMASGISANAMLDFPVRELIAVELVPEVARAAQDHFAPWSGRLFTDPRATVKTGDGRVVLKQLPGTFDAIICDLFFPREDGTANLYSRDFFSQARQRLSSQGVFCLWLPCYQHDPETLGIIVRTFLEVFPHAILVRSNLDPQQPVLGLLGATQPLPLYREFLTRQLSSPTGRQLATQSPFFQSVDHAWLLIAGDLRAAVPGFETSPLTTDDHPLFLFLGARPLNPRQQLIGMQLLNWMGRRFVQPLYPSAMLGQTAPEEILRSVRAANYDYAAAVAQSVIPGDTRPEPVRNRQTATYLEQARALNPQAVLPAEALGK